MSKKLMFWVACAALLGAAAGVQAAGLAITPTAPVPGPTDIANLVESAVDADNVGTPDDPPYANDATTYIAHDRGGQGQTFLTGDNAAGYILTGVWVKHVTYSGADPDMTWYRMQAGAQLQIRVTDPAASGTDGFVLASEVYEVTGTEPNALPSATTNNATGTGLWFHVTLDAPVALAPNAQYGFDLTSLSGLSGVLFFESAGIRDDAVVGGNPYADGAAYVSGAAGVADDLMTAAPGDHVFVVELAEAAPAPTAVMVVNAIDLSLGFDQAMHDRLAGMGYDVTAVLGNDVKNGVFTKADANNFDLVLVSESISSSASDKLIGTTAPVMHNESYGWDNWFFTTATKMGWTVGSDVNMVTDAHPIAAMAGIHPGSMAFFSAQAQWTTELAGAIAPGAKLLAKTTVDGNDLAILFVIEKGAELVGGKTAPARAAGFSIPADKHYDPNAMTDKAWALFDATIQWLNPPARVMEVAADLLVDVSAADPSAGTAVWDNKGTLGDFTFVTAETMPAGSKPTGVGALGVDLTVEQFEGVPVVKVNSASATLAAYVGPQSVPGIEGEGDRTVEAWVADDVLPQAQTVIAWGRRGGNPNGSNVAFGYGTRPNFGAVGQWGDPFDCGWGTNLQDPKTVMANELPAVGVLHHLVYTYENNTVKLYRDGQLVVTRITGEYPMGTGTPAPLSTHAGHTINLFVENNDATGALSNANLPSGLLVNSIRIHDGVLTDAQVLNNYLVGPAQ